MSREELKDLKKWIGLNLAQWAARQELGVTQKTLAETLYGVIDGWANNLSKDAAPTEKAGELREAVSNFADWMETRLQHNDDKGGWDRCTEKYLLDSAASNLEQARTEKDMQYKVEALVDCANFCMMAYDNLKRKLALLRPGQGEKP